MVSGLQNGAMKRYSMTLVHNGERCSLVAYLLDGDSLPSAALKSTPPTPLKKGLQSSTSDTSQSTKKPPKLSSSAMEHIKSAIEALAVEMGTDLHILIPIILELSGESYLDDSLHHDIHNNLHLSALTGADHSHYVESTQPESSEVLTPTNAPGSGQGGPAEGFASQGIGSAAPLLARYVTFTLLENFEYRLRLVVAEVPVRIRQLLMSTTYLP